MFADLPRRSDCSDKKMMNKTIPPGCVQACPGCKYREKSAEESDALKMLWVQKNLLAEISPIRTPAQRWHYRKKALLHARVLEGAWQFGFIRRMGRDEEFIPIPNCPIHEHYISQVLNQLRLPLDLPLVFVLIQGRALTFVLKCAKDLRWEKELDFKIPQMEAQWINWNPAAGRRVLSSKHWTLLQGKKWIGDEFLHGPSGFQQVSGLASQAIEQSEGFFAELDLDYGIDLYSGLGLSLKRWKQNNWHVLGVELGGESVEAARMNSGAEILVGRVEERIPQLKNFLRNRTKEDFFVFTNPPRGGHDPRVNEFLCETRPSRIAYLSCNVKSLAADIAALGYKIRSVQPYDFFPQTDHVEVLALLERP